jgi:hypothetical protein
MHPWFIEEFIAAKGPQTLPLYPYWNTDAAQDTIDFIHSALRTSSSYERIHLWVTCLHGCLISIGLSRGLRKTRGFLEELKSLTERWKDHRNGQHISSDVALQQQPITTELPQDSKDVSEPIYQVDAKAWLMEEWNALQNLTDEVIPGLRRGYIMLGPSEGWDRYLRDPDGMCAHS